MNKIGEIEVKVSRPQLLEILVKNLDAHKAIVKEARDGYVTKAKEVLEKRLAELSNGKVVSLSFNLSVPVDNSKEYNTLIGMLKMSTEETVTLSATEYRCMVEDNWGWKSSFLLSNSAYSQMASGALSFSQDD